MAAGRSLAASLEETGLFTTMITNMVRIGEESGQLPLVMEQIAPYYKEKMETMIGRSRNCSNRSSSWAWASRWPA